MQDNFALVVTHGGIVNHSSSRFMPFSWLHSRDLKLLIDSIRHNSAGKELLELLENIWPMKFDRIVVIDVGESTSEEGQKILTQILEEEPYLSTGLIQLPKSWNKTFSVETESMPYITQKERKSLDQKILELAAEIKNESKKAGFLNYIFTKLVLESYDLPKNQSYQIYNEIDGIFGCCQKEFYRRFTAPYEDSKMRENGDVISGTST